MKSGSELDERWARNHNAAHLRRLIKERAIEYLGGKCRSCGYDRCPAALDFHHPNPREKEFVISGKLAWDLIERELNKCVLLCSNCHRETHDGLHPQYLDDGVDSYELDGMRFASSE